MLYVIFAVDKSLITRVLPWLLGPATRPYNNNNNNNSDDQNNNDIIKLIKNTTKIIKLSVTTFHVMEELAQKKKIVSYLNQNSKTKYSLNIKMATCSLTT